MRLPRSLGAFGMTAVLAVFGGGFVRACATTTTTTTNDVLKVASTCTTMVNKERKARGIAPVAIETRVQTASQRHSNYQAKYGKMTHNEPVPNYRAVERMKNAGYKAGWWGENVAAGQTSCAQVMSAWMHSAGHKANILNPHFKHIGVAAQKTSGGVWFWTMDFGSPG